MGEKGLREVYGELILFLSDLIQSYKAILIALYPSDPVNPNSPALILISTLKSLF